MRKLTKRTSNYFEQAGWNCRLYGGEQFWWRKIEGYNIYISITPSVFGEHDNEGHISIHPNCKYYFTDFTEHSAYILGINSTVITKACFATTMENYNVILRHEDPLSVETVEYITEEIVKWVLVDSPIVHMEKAANTGKIGLMSDGCVSPTTHIIGLALTGNIKRLKSYQQAISANRELFDIKVKYIHKPDADMLKRALEVATGEWKPTGKVYDKMY